MGLPISDSDLDTLSGLSALEAASFQGPTRKGDAAVKHLTKISHLVHFHFWCAKRLV